VQLEKRSAVLKALSKFLPVPFQFERSGTQIVLYEPTAPERQRRDAGH